MNCQRVFWLLELIGIDPSSAAGILGLFVMLGVSAVILLIADRFLSGLKVSGFVGAIVAAVVIAVVSWLLVWLASLLELM